MQILSYYIQCTEQARSIAIKFIDTCPSDYITLNTIQNVLGIFWKDVKAYN